MCPRVWINPAVFTQGRSIDLGGDSSVDVGAIREYVQEKLTALNEIVARHVVVTDMETVKKSKSKKEKPATEGGERKPRKKKQSKLPTADLNDGETAIGTGNRDVGTGNRDMETGNRDVETGRETRDVCATCDGLCTCGIGLSQYEYKQPRLVLYIDSRETQQVVDVLESTLRKGMRTHFDAHTSARTDAHTQCTHSMHTHSMHAHTKASPRS